VFDSYEVFETDVDGIRIAGRRTRASSEKEPLLLLHGHPETHVMWHRVAEDLAADFSVVAPDLRGYGDSSRPRGGGDHSAYSKRTMARDVLGLMNRFGYSSFGVVAHDRGARVAARLAADHPSTVTRALLMDIAPTGMMYDTAEKQFPFKYWHWYFLVQPSPMPESLISAAPRAYVEGVMGARAAGLAPFPPEILDEYVRVLSGPHGAYGICEDYRAAASIDLEHDRDDNQSNRRIEVPLRILWGSKSLVGEIFDPVELWSRVATEVTGRALDCGHYLPEEAPWEVLEEILSTFKA
jgi:haloacetate dehalogenase